MFLKYCFNMKQLNDQWDTFSITFYGPLCFIFTGYLISGAQFSSGYTWLKKFTIEEVDSHCQVVPNML